MQRNTIQHSSKYRQTRAKRTMIAKVVNTFLYHLNSEIESAFRSNQSRTVAALPVNFDIPESINHANFQTEVYFNIVELLQAKDYTVRIHRRGGGALLEVAWTVEDAVDVSHMQRKLQDLSH